MRLGIISDTHGHIEFTTRAVAVLEREGVDCVLHCGDIGSAHIPPLFAGWPTRFVFGNCDYDTASLGAAIRDAGLICHDRFGDFELDGCRIALIHSDDATRFREVIDSGEYDLVCYGHTHVAAAEQRGRTLVLNPGAIYRTSTRSVAIVELPELSYRHVPVDAGSQ